MKVSIGCQETPLKQSFLAFNCFFGYYLDTQVKQMEILQLALF